MVLAGDIGGTKTVLALISTEKGPRHPLAEATFASGDYPSLEPIVAAFLASRDEDVEIASFGVAGPVVDGRAQVTNLPWVVDERELSQALGGAAVHLLNDLEAIANFVPLLGASDLETLNPGRAVEHGPMAVICPGTGLGEAFLVWDGDRYQAHPSEGGHADFAPTNASEIELLRYLKNTFQHVSYERVCSGRGLPNIYAFFKDSGLADEPVWLAEQLAVADDPTPVIVNAALEREEPCKLCVATLNTFISVLGAEAGNLALKVLSTGGVFLGGGIPPRIVPSLKERTFLEAFTQKGRFAKLVAQIPVHVICNPRCALFGAAWHALNEKP